MSGHSKWHNIQAKKGKTDAARGKIFTKIGREMSVIVKAGGADPEVNGKLKDVINSGAQDIYVIKRIYLSRDTIHTRCADLFLLSVAIKQAHLVDLHQNEAKEKTIPAKKVEQIVKLGNSAAL